MSLINGFIYSYKSNSHKIFQEPFDNSDSPKIRSCVKNNGLKNVLKKWFNGLKKKLEQAKLNSGKATTCRNNTSFPGPELI